MVEIGQDLTPQLHTKGLRQIPGAAGIFGSNIVRLGERLPQPRSGVVDIAEGGGGENNSAR